MLGGRESVVRRIVGQRLEAFATAGPRAAGLLEWMRVAQIRQHSPSASGLQSATMQRRRRQPPIASADQRARMPKSRASMSRCRRMSTSGAERPVSFAVAMFGLMTVLSIYFRAGALSPGAVRHSSAGSGGADGRGGVAWLVARSPAGAARRGWRRARAPGDPGGCHHWRRVGEPVFVLALRLAGPGTS